MVSFFTLIGRIGLTVNHKTYGRREGRLDLRHAAVDEELDASDEAGVV
jgi:hypothetical protein